MRPPVTVLLVEDDRDIRESMADALEDEGYAVISAIDGIDGLERLRQATALPDVILLDLMMPRMNGNEFHAHVKEVAAWTRIPIVLITADSNGRGTAERLGVDAFLAKPVKLAALFQTVERIVSV